jgi:hypothetical protein
LGASVRRGQRIISIIKNQFYGDRSGGVKDPVGNHWFVATHKEDLTKEELDKRIEDYIKTTSSQQSEGMTSNHR